MLITQITIVAAAYAVAVFFLFNVLFRMITTADPLDPVGMRPWTEAGKASFVRETWVRAWYVFVACLIGSAGVDGICSGWW